jgi:arylsulfatase A-like enzyme
LLLKPIITHPLRRPLTALLMLLALALVPGSKVPAQAATTQRPNIVFILVDDAGFSDFGAYGSEIATPNIDSLANEGLRFTNFHTASTCEATRVMLHSGVDHHLAGAGTLSVVIAENQKGKPGYEGYLSDRVHSLGQLLRDGGYATYYSGKWNIGDGLERSPAPVAGTATWRWNRLAPTTSRPRSTRPSIWRPCGGRTADAPSCRRISSPASTTPTS